MDCVIDIGDNECNVCFENLEDTVVYNECTHTICGECFKKYFMTYSVTVGGEIPCHICRAPVRGFVSNGECHIVQAVIRPRSDNFREESVTSCRLCLMITFTSIFLISFPLMILIWLSR